MSYGGLGLLFYQGYFGVGTVMIGSVVSDTVSLRQATGGTVKNIDSGEHFLAWDPGSDI